MDGDGRTYSPLLQAAGAEFDQIQDRDDDWATVIEEVSGSGNLLERFEYVAGFFFMHEKGESIIDVLLGPDASPALQAAGDSLVHPARFERNTSYAFFGDARLALLPSVHLVGGFRAGVDHKKTLLRDDGLLGFQRIANQYSALGDPNCHVPAQKFTAVSPKGGIEWDLFEDGLLYVQYQQGTKPGGANANACIQLFDAEKVKAVEGGVKLAFLDGRAGANASVFHYDYENYQLFQIEPPATAVIVNAPKATVLGGELEAAASPFEFLSLDLGLSLLDAQYNRFVQDDPIVAGSQMEDLSGNRLSRAPKYTINGGVELTLPVHRSVLGDVKLRGEARRVDDLYFRQFNRDFDRQNAYTTGDVVVLLRSESGRFALRGFVKNVGDARYILSQLASPADPLFTANPANATTGAGAFYGLYGPPRTWGVELTAYF